MKKRTSRTAVALAICLLAVVGGASCKTGPEDATITASVKSKLAADTTVTASAINVDTKDGVVTLNGTATSEAEKAKAESIAKGVEGVKSVHNNLAVRPPVATTPPAMPSTTTANDTAIENAIMAKLKAAGLNEVTVDVEGGVATLSGTVTKANLPKAMQAANEVTPKPTRVNNQMTVK